MKKFSYKFKVCTSPRYCGEDTDTGERITGTIHAETQEKAKILAEKEAEKVVDTWENPAAFELVLAYCEEIE